MDITTLAKYPFLKESKEYIKNINFSVEELLHDIAYERARAIGIERLENAFNKGDVGTRGLATETDCIMELLSYPLARMISVCVDDPYFKRRYALGEAIHFYKYLQNENLSFILYIARELGFDVQLVEDVTKNKVKIHFVDYLHNAPTRYKSWKTVNRILNNGYIQVSERELARLIEEALRENINNELNARNCTKDIYNTFKKEINAFKNLVETRRKSAEIKPVGKISITKLPPCMKHILRSIQSGENVPHMGRFAFVSFLYLLGLTIDEILALFSSAPDYDEERTLYQVKHVTGMASSTKYSPPGCRKMRTYGLCPAEEMNDICKKVNHPLSYYKVKWKLEKKKTSKEK